MVINCSFKIFTIGSNRVKLRFNQEMYFVFLIATYYLKIEYNFNKGSMLKSKICSK
jgi:hypothetical protein